MYNRIYNEFLNYVKSILQYRIFSYRICFIDIKINLNFLNDSRSNEIRLIDIEGHNQDNQFFPGKSILKTNRVGLTAKKTDLSDYYLNLDLRYIIVLQSFPNFKQSVKGIEAIVRTKLASGELDADQAKGILGYSLN